MLAFQIRYMVLASFNSLFGVYKDRNILSERSVKCFAGHSPRVSTGSQPLYRTPAFSPLNERRLDLLDPTSHSLEFGHQGWVYRRGL
jgi:hypothetical protein